LKPYSEIWNPTQKFETLFRNLEPYSEIWNHTQKFETLLRNLEPYSEIRNPIQKFGTLLRILKPYSEIWNPTQKFETILRNFHILFVYRVDIILKTSHFLGDQGNWRHLPCTTEYRETSNLRWLLSQEGISRKK